MEIPDCHCHSPPHRRAVSTMAFTMKPRGFQSALPRVVVTKVPQTTGSFDHFGRFGCVYSDFELFFGTHFPWKWHAFHSFLMFSLQAKEIRVAKCAKGNPVLRPSKWWTSTVGYHERRGIMEKIWENDGIGKGKITSNCQRVTRENLVVESYKHRIVWNFETNLCQQGLLYMPSLRSRILTVDGSEIPFPTTWDVSQTPVNSGISTTWFSRRISGCHQQD